MKNKKGLLIGGLILSALLILFVILQISGVSIFHSSDANQYQTSIVDRGEVFLSIEGIGTVEPENEVILLSPNNSIIKSINKEPGSRVKQGEIIIELDDHSTLEEIEQITDQLEVKSNSLERSRLEGQMARIDLDYNVEVKKLKVASMKAQLANEEQLLAVGGISSAKLDETKQNLVLAQKDLDMVLKKNAIRISQMRTEESGLLLQIDIQKKQLADKLEMLGKMKIKAPSDGIILAIAGKEGEKVGNDKMLITLSDLTTFKVRGLIDEKYSDYIKTGNQVFIYQENEKINGIIGNITPSVADSKIQFNVHLDTINNTKLIPNQSVKLQILKSVKNEVLRISAKNDFTNNSKRTVYILDSGKMIPKTVTFGLKGSAYQEVISGLNEGDKVIVSDSPLIWKVNADEKKQ